MAVLYQGMQTPGEVEFFYIQNGHKCCKLLLKLLKADFELEFGN